MEIIIAFALFFIAGMLHGGREAYHADNKIFEKELGAGELSFFGSKAWLRNYINNTYPGKHKPQWGNTFRDFWHFSGFFSRLFLVAGVALILFDGNWIALAITVGGLVLFPVASWLVYNELR